ncbi:hypothetical protein PPYR_14952 [Photinus pyralis]|uniref:Uncharacterized protein n=2 Tax=Photinus pyralis TaxID=7054 RepID=A0A5N4A0L3_PHOPY|nr:uncharacterized protein LOC116181724 [Photinus pyralis]KAB0790865.1 hypothetical protein PPYR_14952 [Photinus pyralis]
MYIDALVLLNAMLLSAALQYDCSKSEYERCVRMADPLIKEVRLIFPDNMNDVHLVCRTWNDFVDCLKRFTDRCFTDQQRSQFNKAIENPIQSVHQMCTQPRYQKEYLQHAPCMKGTVIDDGRCGSHYRFLVEQVDQGDVISKATLCCSHDRFKQCVLREARESCDRGVPNGPASRFSAQTIDKALSFLQDQCFNYIPNSGDCTLPFDAVSLSTSPSEIYPWNTRHDDLAAKEISPTRVASPRPTPTVSLYTPTIDDPQDSSFLASSQSLGSRTRPASYGRASSWSDAPPTQNTQVSVSTGAPQTSQSGQGVTTSTWTVLSTSPELRKEVQPLEWERSRTQTSSSTTWYPAAGHQLSNEVDEPNQLGLVNPHGGNTASGRCAVNVLLIVAALLLA